MYIWDNSIYGKLTFWETRPKPETLPCQLLSVCCFRFVVFISVAIFDLIVSCFGLFGFLVHAFRKQWSRTNIVANADVTNADRLLAADVWCVIVVVTLSGPGVVLQWKTCDSRFAMFAIVILIDLVARGCTSIGNLGRCGKPMSVSSSSAYPPVPPNLILNLEIV